MARLVRVQMEGGKGYLWLNPTHINAVGPAFDKRGVPVIGHTMITQVGAPPITLDGAPEDVAAEVSYALSIHRFVPVEGDGDDS